MASMRRRAILASSSLDGCARELLVVCARLFEQAQVVLALRDHEQVCLLGHKLVGELELDQGLLFVASLEETDARLVVLAGLRGGIGLLRLRRRARDQRTPAARAASKSRDRGGPRAKATAGGHDRVHSSLW